MASNSQGWEGKDRYQLLVLVVQQESLHSEDRFLD